MHKHFSLLDVTRRHFFSDCGIGVGKMALASLLTGSVSNQATAGQAESIATRSPAATPRRHREGRDSTFHGRSAEPIRTL